MDILQPFRIIKMKAKIRNNNIYIRQIKLQAIKEKRELTENEAWAIKESENENARYDLYIRAGIA